MGERRRGPGDLLWVPLLLVLLVPVALRLGQHREYLPDQAPGPLIQGRAGLDSLLADAGGKVVIVNFWATWCTPCVGELPSIDRISRTMADSVVAVAVDIGDPDMEKLLSFREGMVLSLPMVWLPPGEVEALKRDWDLSDLIPVTVFLDPDGDEYLRVSGTREEDFFREAVLSGAGCIMPADSSTAECLHVNVVGPPDDPLTGELLDLALELAGPGHVDLFDPTLPGDLEMMRTLYLPETGYPYAQACVGTACGRPSSTREELLESVETLCL
jgi:thiol-disulfide isomerase/thioredoxin